MTDDRSTEGIVAEVLSGENRELSSLVARGLFPLPPEELIPLQVKLAQSEDEELAAAARDSLSEVDPRILTPLIPAFSRRDMDYFATESPHPVVIEAILRRRDVDRSLLVKVAPNLSPDLQELLLLRQDAVIENPEILDALERNEDLSSYARRRVREYREHLLPRERAADEVERLADVDLDPGASEEEVAEAIEQAREEEPGDGAVDELTNLTEAQIRTLPIPVRLSLARGAPRQLRGILVRDGNPRVAVSVLRFNAVTDSEIEQICRSRSVAEDVLKYIAGQRQWARRYPVVHALAQNPRTPLPLALKLVPRLSVRDLRELGKDRNVADAVRAQARRLYTIKTR